MGITTLDTMQGQTRQLEGMVENLDDIHFTLQKAKKMIRDLMKGLATDKCILSLLALVVVLIIVALVLRYTGIVDKDTVRAPGMDGPAPAPEAQEAPAPGPTAGALPAGGRRALGMWG